jgi:hypothetical protein
MNTGQFVKGNKAAGRPSKKAVAAAIRHRLETDADNLTSSQFTALTNRFAALTRPRRRRRKEPESKKVLCYADTLTGEAKEIHETVMRIEAEQRETRRREREAEQKASSLSLKERKPTPTPPAAAWVNTVFPGFNEHVRTKQLD